MKALSQILGYDNLTGLVQTNVNGIPVNILPPGFQTTTGRFRGNQGRYNKVAGTQQAATVVNYGGPANVVNKWGLGTVPVTLLHTFESINFDPLDLMHLQAEDSPVLQQMGRQTLERNLANFAMRFQNLRLSAIMSALATGCIYFDAAGNLLPTSAGSAFGVDYSVPAGNKAQVGGIIAATWATDGTDIASQIEDLQAKSLQTTGKLLEYAFYGANIPEYLLSNTQIGALIKASPSLSEEAVRSALPLPAGLLGLKWVPGSRAFYRDSANAVQTWVGDDVVIFTPAPSADWWGFLEGSYLVPRSIELSGDAQSALNDMAEVTGPFSFAAKAINPPGITHFAGDTFLPVISNPEAIYITDVTP